MKNKRFLIHVIGSCCMFIAAASCSNDNINPVTPPDGGETVKPTEGVSTEAFYKGDHYGTETGNLWINFISDMEFDDWAGDYVGPGYILCLDFNTVLAENPDFASLAEGTYTCDYSNDTHEEFTLNVADGDSYLTRYDESGSYESFNIIGGDVKVAIKDGYYCIDAALTLDDESDYSYSFIGEISFINRSDEGEMSNMTQDVVLSGMSQALVAYGGYAFTETSDLYTVIIAGPDYDLDSNFGQSDALMLSVNVTPGSSDGIPSGTYTIIDANTADDYDVNTALSGFYEPTYGGYFGSWYFSTENRIEASVRGGFVTITDNGNDNYTFEIALEDGYGHKITGTYSGPCQVEDWS